MKRHLISVCGGNWRGYTGTKNEIENMRKQIMQDEQNDKIQIFVKEENNEVTLEYWSKW